ncbi:MAG: polysaccharide biosynthesis C-terminal domain-containing protein [Spirosomataceae bacterium]
MSILKKLAGETVLYGVPSILGRTINFFLVALHTQVFPKPGMLSSNIELYAYAAILNVLYTYGMETAFFRYASRAENPRFYYNLVLTAILSTSVLFSGTMILFAPQLAAALDYRGEETNIVWMAIIIAIDAIVAIPFAWLRLQKKAKKFAGIRMTNILLNVGLNFFFLWFCKGIYENHFLAELKPMMAWMYNPQLGVGYIFLANLIANGMMIPMLWREFRMFRPTLDAEQFKIVWVYAYPILIMGLAGTVNLMTDRLLLKYLLPDGFYPGRTAKDVLGIYGNCYKLSIFVNLVIQAFRYAAEPFFFSQAKDRNAPETFALVMKWFIICCVLIWVGVSLNLDFVAHWFLRNKVYQEGLGVVSILLLANVFLGIYYNLSIWFKLSDKTYYGTLITLLGAGLTVGLNVLLIPQIGYEGCAITFLLSCFIMTLVCYWLGSIHYPIPYDLTSALGYIGSAGLLIWASSKIQISNLWIAVPYHLGLCLLYVAGIVIIERKTLWKLAPKKLQTKRGENP